jgi:hypothetical protein
MGVEYRLEDDTMRPRRWLDKHEAVARLPDQPL